MTRKQNVPADAVDRSGNLLALSVLAPIVGAAAGLLGAVFRLALEKADHLRDALISWGHGDFSSSMRPGSFAMSANAPRASKSRLRPSA